ncbi:GntR family transcriptional regulator [Rhodobacteraceae bacterium D3-12]|nr:GntR family transcriptional regulator [Rhodobacteraceae bacterium D3-12]
MKDKTVMARRTGENKLYTVVSDQLRRQIRSGTRCPGDRLPAMDQLAVEFDVSIVTIRTAIEILENEGLLMRRQGRGTFVARTAQAREWLKISTSWDDLISGYADTQTKNENEVLIETPGRSLPLDVGDVKSENCAPSYIFMRRRHRMEGLVYAYTDLYLDEEIYRLAPESFKMDMVLRVLGTTPGVEIGSATQSISIGTADAETADLLNLTVGAPVGELLRLVEDPDGQIMYRGMVFYRGDLVRVSTRLK